MPKKRIAFFDVAKCVAIFFIVLGHVGIVYPSTMAGGMPSKVVHLAFSCHLPVFFVASGYFFKLDTVLNKQFFKRAWSNIITPYIVTCAIIILGCVIVAGVLNTGMREAFIHWLQAALYGAGSSTTLMFVPVERIGGIWFLLALFWAQIIILIVQRLPKPTLWIVGLFIVGWRSALHVQLPLSIQAGVCAAAFVYAGAQARKYKILETDGLPQKVAFGVCLVIWAVYLLATNENMSFALFALPSGIGDVIGSFAAAYVVFRTCRFIEKHCAAITKFMAWVGRNTLVIFCFHIVEDDVFLGCLWTPFIQWCTGVFPHGGWVVFLIVRLAFIACMCGIVYLVPKLNAVYFPTLRKKVKTPTKPAPKHVKASR